MGLRQKRRLGVAAGCTLLKSSLEPDPALREDSIAIARESRDLLRSNPRAGWIEMKALVEGHLRLSVVFLKCTEHARALTAASGTQRGSHHGTRTRETRH